VDGFVRSILVTFTIFQEKLVDLAHSGVRQRNLHRITQSFKR
jgi:hypothetical protein